MITRDNSCCQFGSYVLELPSVVCDFPSIVGIILTFILFSFREKPKPITYITTKEELSKIRLSRHKLERYDYSSSTVIVITVKLIKIFIAE